MSTTLIAVAVQEDGTLSPHAGRALHWDVYAIENNSSQHELVWQIDLSEAGCLHEWHVRGDGNRHPLHAVDIALAGSGGDGVIRRLAERHTTLVATAETNPYQAICAYLAGNLSDGLPHDEGTCLNPQHRQRRIESSEEH